MRVLEAFESIAAPWLDARPEIPGEWEREKNWRFLEIQPSGPGGFGVRANCSEEFVYVMLDRTLVVERGEMAPGRASPAVWIDRLPITAVQFRPP